MTKKDLKDMQTKEMLHCESCGGYHTLEDSEVVVIKIIKGKECPMPNTANKTMPVRESERSREISNPELAPVPPQPPAQRTPRKQIIPPGFASLMIPPSNPAFESRGAKETRVV